MITWGLIRGLFHRQRGHFVRAPDDVMMVWSFYLPAALMLSNKMHIYIYDSICIYDILSVIKFMYEPCSCFFSGYHVKLVRDNAGPAFGSYHDPLFVWNPGQILSPVRHCCRMEDLASFRLDFAGIATWPMPRGEAWPMDKWWLNQENMVIEHEHYTNRNEGGRMEGWSRWMRRI